MRLTSIEEFIRERELYKRFLDKQYKKIIVCGGTGCIAGGSIGVYEELKKLINEKGILAEVDLVKEDQGVGVKKSGCHGFCEKGPLVRIEPNNYLYLKVKPEDCEEIVNETILNDRPVARLMYNSDGKIYETEESIPFYDKQNRIALENCGHIDAESIQEYIANDGYSALVKALGNMTPEDVCKEILDSNLRGRGGRGYPTGKKWKKVRLCQSDIKYVICNADEGHPGAFMDRSILEGDPHSIIEGMIIAGYATGATEGYIYVRYEYPLAIERLTKAITDARELGLLGKNILGTDFSFDIHISKGAGAFVSGAGSALVATIQGEVSMPKVKAKRTAEEGLWKKPTVINNVETFANVRHIILKGADWYRNNGTENSPGTKVFALTGCINNTGLIEVPMGTTLREIIFDIGGGIKDNKKFKAVQIGGPSGVCLTEEHLDIAIDFDSLIDTGSTIGSGAIFVIDEDTSIVSAARFFMNFTQNESCGKCIPCREGTKRILNILDRIIDGKGKMEDLDLLEELAETMANTSFCRIGKTAANPVLSSIKYFRDEYIDCILDRKSSNQKRISQKFNTVEDINGFANVSYIPMNQSDWYKSSDSKKNNTLPKTFLLSGDVEKTGLIQVPMDITLRDLIFEIGGGIKCGKKFKAIQIGGPFGSVLTEDYLDRPLNSLENIGNMIDSRNMIVMDEDTCMVSAARFFINFNKNKSCGKCIPCREGTNRMLGTLDKIIEGKGEMEDLELLEELADAMAYTSCCTIGKTAANPVLSSIRHFRDEYIYYIVNKNCSIRDLSKLNVLEVNPRIIKIDPNICKGCSKCSRICPTGAISGIIKKPFSIDQEKCIKCGTCLESCSFTAIKEA